MILFDGEKTHLMSVIAQSGLPYEKALKFAKKHGAAKDVMRVVDAFYFPKTSDVEAAEVARDYAAWVKTLKPMKSKNPTSDLNH